MSLGSFRYFECFLSVFSLLSLLSLLGLFSLLSILSLIESFHSFESFSVRRIINWEIFDSGGHLCNNRRGGEGHMCNHPFYYLKFRIIFRYRQIFLR